MSFELKIQKTNFGIRISIFEILGVPISGKTDNFDFFGPNSPKDGFWGRNFEKLNPDAESAPPRYHVCQFSGKTDNFETFCLNLGKFPNYVRYFGSYNFEGVAESCVQAEMSLVEVVGAGWRLKWVWWRCMELGGGGWRWMEVGGGGCMV